MGVRPRLSAVVLVVGVAGAAVSTPPAVAANGAMHETGRTANGQWVLDVPRDFNGTLLLWSHGYTFTPVAASNAPTVATRDALLAEGSASWVRRTRTGCRVGRAGGRCAGREAVGIAQRRIGTRRVTTVLAWGNSLGGLVTQTLAEKRPGLIDGAAPLCGVLAGTNRNLDLALDVAVGVKRFFYRKLKLRNYRSRAQAQANFDAASAAIMAKLAGPATQTGATGRVLGLAAMTDASAKTKTYNGTSTTSSVAAATESLLTALNYGTLGRYDIEQRVGANPSTNRGTDYRKRVTKAATARFTAFGFGAGLLSAYAQTLETYGKRVGANAKARKAASRLGNPSGDLSDPTVTMHTVHDPLVIVQNERVFAKRVASRGDGERLLQLYIRPPSYTSAAPYGAGHCNFTTEQWLVVVVVPSTAGCARACCPAPPRSPRPSPATSR